MEEFQKQLEDLEEQLQYCEKLVASETRLDVAVLILEELQSKIQKIKESSGVVDERLTALADRVKLLYHRAKALLSLQEGRNAYRQFED
ncbi:MAG TPA: hypothetical protein EYH45_05365 [Candidatus Caldiarchaeum subterraneum]|uniref:Uncharacterized protein n=1 Tax=Caldiarchaeum subterraneum TaxID=311458 RepID=A0A833ECN4_CALS0|nr:hypothetical protein [Candidatus Caldarchaeum subterraneum]